MLQPRQVIMRVNPSGRRPPPRPTAKAAGTVAVELAAQAQPVFERLRAWRAATARRRTCARPMSISMMRRSPRSAQSPGSLNELAGVSGVGEAKLAKYGQQILDTYAGQLTPAPARAQDRGQIAVSPIGGEGDLAPITGVGKPSKRRFLVSVPATAMHSARQRFSQEAMVDITP